MGVGVGVKVRSGQGWRKIASMHARVSKCGFRDLCIAIAASVSFVGARMAGGAVLGSAATIAFLCSPLAERALEWLA